MTLRNETDAPLSDVPINLFSSRRSRLFVGRRGVVASTVSTVIIVALIVGLLYIPKGGATVRFTVPRVPTGVCVVSRAVRIGTTVVVARTTLDVH